MKATFPPVASVQPAPAAHTSAAPGAKVAGPVRVAVVGAVLLSVLVVISAGVFLLDLRNRMLVENERTLSNTTLIVAKQIAHLFATVQTVQEGIIEHTDVVASLDRDDGEHKLSSHDIHVKLRDRAAGMPYVGSLTIVNAQGRVINFSRQWPIPSIDVTDRDFFKALRSDPTLTSFLSEPVRNRATDTWVMHLAHRISGPRGEFLGLITAAIELKYLHDSFSEIAFGPDSGMDLYRDDGTLLARIPRIETDIGRRFPAARALQLVAAADHGVAVTVGETDGRARLVAAHRVGSYPVLVAATRTMATVLVDWKRTATYVALIAALTIGTIAALSVLFIKLFRNYHALLKTGVERENAEHFRSQSLRLDVALNNMSQGLIMFDASERIVLCNRRYLDMYELSPDIVRPGCTLRELLRLRQAQGSLSEDAEECRRMLLSNLAQGKSDRIVAENATGRSYHIINVPMAGGGWVATHEDVTEKFLAQKAYERQKLQLDAALENMSQGLCLFDAAQRLVVCNKQYAELYGLNEEQMKPGTSLRTILEYRVARGAAPEDHDAYINDRIREVTINRPYQITNRLSDGRCVSVVHRPMPGGGWVATHEDISERRRAEDELDETKRFLDSIIDNVPIAVVVRDARTRKYVLVNRAFEALTGLPQSQLLGKTVFDVFPALDAETVDKRDSEYLQGNTNASIAADEHEVQTPARGPRVVTSSRFVVRDTQANAKYLIVVIDDITERKKSERQIVFMAHHDALTGLVNRSAMMLTIEDAAARQRRSGERFTVLLLDLDRFKYVNDTLGHPAGDALLRETAARLKPFLRETDVLARLGGDEFAIVQVGATDQREAASALAERIIGILAEPFDIDGNEVNIGASIGIALAPEHGTNPDNLLKMADLALYRAKTAGRNGYCFFHPEMSIAASERHELDNELRRAVQQDELELHYQPIVDARTLRICGVEALVRWRHPTKGMIFPDQFIPIAEETGVIAQIGEWILHAACAEAATWPADIKIAINLSAVQLRKANLPDVVMHALARSGLPAARLELEITETALIDSRAECLSALRTFKSLGIAVALDDFGTGYSSLSQLTMFPFDKIKIDKSFTQNFTKRADCAAIMSAALNLAQSLEMTTTAEGVETTDQYRLLRLAGVTSLQGYLFARPRPIAEIDFNRVYAFASIVDAA